MALNRFCALALIPRTYLRSSISSLFLFSIPYLCICYSNIVVDAFLNITPPQKQLQSKTTVSKQSYRPLTSPSSAKMTSPIVHQSSHEADIANCDANNSKKDKSLPTMIVFDLDDCLWSPEMYTLHNVPSIPEEGDLTPPGVNDLNARGCVGMKVPRGPTVRLFGGARRVLYELATDPKYKSVIIASASSSEEPTFSYSCLRGIEILPGLTMDKMFRYNQIGRTGQLSSDKRTHFRLLHKESKVPYEEMLFFDDCNWGDHCATVTREFGVVSMRTPRGLQYNEFQEALEKYRREVQKRSE